ncbi:hypothetical protein PFISCL1PPCAC_3740, partial [Pristionchus fissidentatus]
MGSPLQIDGIENVVDEAPPPRFFSFLLELLVATTAILIFGLLVSTVSMPGKPSTRFATHSTPATIAETTVTTTPKSVPESISIDDS